MLHDWRNLKNKLYHVSSNYKLKPIKTCSRSFSRASCDSSFDWFIGFSAVFVIGYSDYFGFGFTTFISLIVL